MATSATKLTGERLVFANAEYFHVTPYEAGSETTVGTTTYDIVDIVGDTLSFTQDENTVNAKEWEFGDTPLFETVNLGNWQFAANCVDFRNEIMQVLYGWTVQNDAVIAPNAYKDLYAVVEVGFKNAEKAIVVPKLKLNSRATLANFKTGTGEGELAGTAYNSDFKIADEAVNAPMAFVKDGTAYTVGAKTFTVGAGTTEE